MLCQTKLFLYHICVFCVHECISSEQIICYDNENDYFSHDNKIFFSLAENNNLKKTCKIFIVASLVPGLHNSVTVIT